MTSEPSDLMPLVSVIVPCFNHGNYLAQAIESILQQTYAAKEIIIVDDGSTDNTGEVAASFSGVRYIRQSNQGLSAARNTGIKHARGSLLIFADADDVLLPAALALQVEYLCADPGLAFVSGGHIKVDKDLVPIEEVTTAIPGEHYKHLLTGNYIGMHGTVLYRREVLVGELFDTSLKAAEDYDVYLRIALQHKVAHHQTPLALYRQHGDNMSRNLAFMLDSVLLVLAKQRGNLNTAELKAAYREGRRIWKEYYCSKMYLALRAHPNALPPSLAKQFARSLCKHRSDLYIRFLISKILSHQKLKKITTLIFSSLPV